MRNRILIVWIGLLAGLVHAADGQTQITNLNLGRQEQQFADASDSVLLITSSELEKAWRPFANWKTACGKPTRIRTVDQIAENYEGGTIQEKIRRCVRKHIEKNKTRWVILGGDCLPNGKGHVPGGPVTVHAREPRGIPTDIVYLSPTDWDADGDGIHGEFEDDRKAISYPDGSIGLGRIPVRSIADVRAFTEKVIEYESQYPTDQFASNMVYTCTDQPAYAKVRNSWDGYVSRNWNGQVQRFFSAETPWDGDVPGSYPLSAENLVGMINQKKVAKLHIHGHGHLPAWVLEKSTFTGKHVQELKNRSAYPLITTVSCNTGEFDSPRDPSIVEQMIRAPRAGSVAIVAPIRTGKPHFAKRSDFRLMITEGKLDGTTLTMTRYWVNGLGDGNSTGHSLMKAKQQMAEDGRKSPAYHLCICELNLLGDPTLDMRSSAPVNPVWNMTTKTGKRSTLVSIKSNAPGCTVCCWAGNHKKGYLVKIADPSGNTNFEIDSKIREFKVTVSGRNLNASSRTIGLDGKKQD